MVLTSIANPILFLSLYIIPILNLSNTVKTVLFVVIIVAAYLIYNVAHPQKINWLMSTVDEMHRGIFTANKEIVSLVVGMAFSYGAGALSDYFVEKRDVNTSFIVFATMGLGLTVVHTFTMLPITDDFQVTHRKINIIQTLKNLFGNKNLAKVTVLFVIYYIIKDVAAPFYGVYLIKDLNMKLTTVTILGIVSSASRILVSRFWGRYADKKSFASMVEKCFIFLTLGYVFVVFANPSTGLFMFAGYYVCNGIALGGINSAITNMVFDYIEPERRADALAVSQTACGIIGFVTTIAVSPLVTLVQGAGNQVLGLTVYAQQILSALAAIMCVFAILFVRLTLIGKSKTE